MKDSARDRERERERERDREIGKLKKNKSLPVEAIRKILVKKWKRRYNL